MRRALYVFALPALLALCGLAEATAHQPSRRRAKKKLRGQGYEVATTTDEKLRALTDLKMTTAEIALAAGASARAIEERRRRKGHGEARHSKVDDGIDAVYSIAVLLQGRQVPAHNVRAWLIGRSAYLDEQRPAALLSTGQFELVRRAAIAYATSETPEEFREQTGPIVRVPDPALKVGVGDANL